MASLSFLAVSDALTKDFNKRQKEYHAKQQEYQLAQDTNKGGIEMTINTALQKLRNKGAMDLQNDQQLSDFAGEQAKIENLKAMTKGQEFDNRLGMDYSGSFLEGKRITDSLYRDYLKKELGLGNQEQGQIPSNLFNREEPESISQLPFKKEKTNLLRYSGPAVSLRAVRKFGQLGNNLGSYLKRNFTFSTDNLFK